MRSVMFHAQEDDYRSYVHDHIFAALLDDAPPAGRRYYQHLIDWVIAERAPVFYQPSQVEEDRNFSNWFGWQVIRDRYTNPTLAALFYLHEFVHLLTWTPTDPLTVSAEVFAEAVTASEYLASNESELLVHWRLPALRQRVLTGQTILFDYLHARPGGRRRPSAAELYRTRAELIETDQADSLFAGDREMATFYKRFAGNRAWARQYLGQVRTSWRTGAPLVSPAHLSVGEYEEVISSYRYHADQGRYARRLTANVALACRLEGLADEPERIDQVPAFFDRLTTKALLCSPINGELAVR